MQLDNKTEYAGFWVRVWASLIDTLLIVSIILPALIAIYGWQYLASSEFISGVWDFILNWILPAIAVVVFWIYRSATPGKMIFKLKIVNAADGEKPSTKQFIGRYLAYYVSVLPLLAGIFWVAFDKKKQGWHDKLAKTVVVRPKRKKELKKGWRIAGYLAGSIGLVIFLIVFAVGIAEMAGYLPPSGIVTGEQIRQPNRSFLVDNKYVSADEKIIYFYSAGVLSIEDDGNLLTDRRIISYWTDENGAYFEAIALDDVTDVSVTYSQAWYEDTKITVVGDDKEVILFISSDNGLDKVFVKSLNDLVEKIQSRNQLISSENTA